MEIYKKNAQPPKWALKQIQAGRLKGKTDINPQWRYQALTETFGLVGFGWKYEVKRTWLEQGANAEVTANAEVLLFVKRDDVWSDAIPGIGGASFIAKEKNGMYTSDECYKMAITDALSVACKMLGIGSDIYAGKWDGSKYKIDSQPNSKKELLLDSKDYTKAFNYIINGYTDKEGVPREVTIEDIKKQFILTDKVEKKLKEDLEQSIAEAADIKINQVK